MLTTHSAEPLYRLQELSNHLARCMAETDALVLGHSDLVELREVCEATLKAAVLPEHPCESCNTTATSHYCDNHDPGCIDCGAGDDLKCSGCASW